MPKFEIDSAVCRWVAERNSLTHDWIKNVVLPFLGYWTNVLDGGVRDPEFLDSAAERLRADWDGTLARTTTLLSHVESAVTPRLLLECPPLDRLNPADRRAIGVVIHTVWWARVRPLWTLAQEAFTSTSVTFDVLDRELARGRPQADTVDAFRSSCAALGEALQRLPRGIEVP